MIVLWFMLVVRTTMSFILFIFILVEEVDTGHQCSCFEHPLFGFCGQSGR